MTNSRKTYSPYGSVKFSNIDEYHLSFPDNIRKKLEQLRLTIREVVPESLETISYNIPTFKKIVSYAGYKNHIGLYPGAAALSIFREELTHFKTAKGTIQFPIDQPLPTHLITKIIRFRAEEARKTNLPNSPKRMKTNNDHNTQQDILLYHSKQSITDKAICDLLLNEINSGLPEAESKVWHGHPVWFIDGNPIAGYSKEKRGLRLMFWSGASFDEPALLVRGEKFKDASIFYQAVSDINTTDLQRWLKKSVEIQWDYKNIVKRKGVLERLK